MQISEKSFKMIAFELASIINHIKVINFACIPFNVINFNFGMRTPFK
jgi:hypothetical protein